VHEVIFKFHFANGATGRATRNNAEATSSSWLATPRLAVGPLLPQKMGSEKCADRSGPACTEGAAFSSLGPVSHLMTNSTFCDAICK